LPIHVRYQESALEDYVNFTLRPPSLFYRLDSGNLIDANFKKENFNLPMLINSTEFLQNELVFPCEKGKFEKKTNKLILQRTYDYLTRTYLKDNEVEIDHEYINSNLDGLCIWSKLEYEQVSYLISMYHFQMYVSI
jgi:hypothetical protein